MELIGGRCFVTLCFFIAFVNQKFYGANGFCYGQAKKLNSSQGVPLPFGRKRVELRATAAFASVVAGSLGGAIGVGVAFPLDTLKTKAQVLSQDKSHTSTTIRSDDRLPANVFKSDHLNDSTNMSMMPLIAYIYKAEGISGFYGGVKGQAFVKSLAFSAHAGAISYLKDSEVLTDPTLSLLAAACYAGFVTSFFVTPIEKVKVMMQASSIYENEIDCLQSIIKEEGLPGLVTRGLDATLAREIPGYGIYFLLYGLLTNTATADSLGAAVPLVLGTLAGMVSWIPVYPIDVVKTLSQNTEGGEDSKGSFAIAKDLYEVGGISAFYDGLTPKMMYRAAINHAVTFFVYDSIIQWFAKFDSSKS